MLFVQRCCIPGVTFWIAHHELSPWILGANRGELDCGLILFTRQWLLQSVLSAVVRGSSRSALLTICCMVSCDYSPRRLKKEGEISSAVVSDLHTLSISSAQLLSVRPSATEHVQQLYCCTFLQATWQKIYIERDCSDLLCISHFFFSPHPPSFIWYIMLQILTLISLHIYYSECQRHNLIGSLYYLVQMFASADFHMNVVQYWLLLLWYYSSGVRNLWDISTFTRVHTLSH